MKLKVITYSMFLFFICLGGSVVWDKVKSFFFDETKHDEKYEKYIDIPSKVLDQLSEAEKIIIKNNKLLHQQVEKLARENVTVSQKMKGTQEKVDIKLAIAEENVEKVIEQQKQHHNILIKDLNVQVMQSLAGAEQKFEKKQELISAAVQDIDAKHERVEKDLAKEIELQQKSCEFVIKNVELKQNEFEKNIEHVVDRQKNAHDAAIKKIEAVVESSRNEENEKMVAVEAKQLQVKKELEETFNKELSHVNLIGREADLKHSLAEKNIEETLQQIDLKHSQTGRRIEQDFEKRQNEQIALLKELDLKISQTQKELNRLRADQEALHVDSMKNLDLKNKQVEKDAALHVTQYQEQAAATIKALDVKLEQVAQRFDKEISDQQLKIAAMNLRLETATEKQKNEHERAEKFKKKYIEERAHREVLGEALQQQLND